MDHSHRATRFVDLNADQARTIDEICDCFEHQLYTRRGPSIENLVLGGPEPERSILLYELLVLEIERSLARGDTLRPDEYYRRFPLDAVLIRDVLSEYLPEKPLAASDTIQRLPKIPNYRVLRELSSGGMGAVYEAMHTKLGSLAAIKVLKEELVSDLDAEIRFEREMKVIGTLAHPNIVSARDAGKSDGMHYLVMEYVIGSDLADLVEQLGPLDAADACEIARRVANALDHANQLNLVHRDIKPKNILIGHSSGTQGPVEVKVADFGLALLRGHPKPSDTSAPGEVVGTVTYMAPEQFWQQRSDIRSDIYSLGCTLYFLLLGAPPFGRIQFPGTRRMMEAHRDVRPPDLGEIHDESLQRIIHQMLAKNPDSRQQTPAEVEEMLLPFSVGHNLQRLFDGNNRRRTDGDSDLPETRVIRQSSLGSSPTDAISWDAPSTHSDHLDQDSTPASPSGDFAGAPFSDDQADRDHAEPCSTGLHRRVLIGGTTAALAIMFLAIWISPLLSPAPVNLLQQIDPLRDSISGTWTQNDHGLLLSPDEPKGVIALRSEVPDGYQLEIEARRKTGGRMAVGLVHGGRQYPIEMDSAAVGAKLQLSESESVERNQQARQLGFARGKKNTITCLVQPDGIVVAWEDQVYVVASQSELEGVASTGWRTPGYSGLFLGTQASVYEFAGITLRPVER